MRGGRAGQGGEAEAAIRRSAPDGHRPEGDLHRHDADLVRRDRDRARSEERAPDRQLLRVPRRRGVLRRAVLPSSRHLDRRDPGRRSVGGRHRRARLRDPRRADGERVLHARHPRDGERGCELGREPVLPHHRSGRHQPRREPGLHDLREGDRRPRRRAADPEAADRGPRFRRHLRAAACGGRLHRVGDDREVRRGG